MKTVEAKHLREAAENIGWRGCCQALANALAPQPDFWTNGEWWLAEWALRPFAPDPSFSYGYWWDNNLPPSQEERVLFLLFLAAAWDDIT